MRKLFAALGGLVLFAAIFAYAKIVHNRWAQPAHASVTGTRVGVALAKPPAREPTEFSRAMPMGDHMMMAETRPVQPGDWERADAIAEAAHKFVLRYMDYHAAERDGYLPFMPKQRMPVYHFNRLTGPPGWDPDRPASIIYEKPGPHGEKNGYHLVGVMYNAPANATAAQLDRIAPLSIAHWHMHTNGCWAPAGYPGDWMVEGKEFGYSGSITTEAECKARGGTFHAQEPWNIHVFPLHKDPAERWHEGMSDEGNDMKMDARMTDGRKR